MSDGILNQFLSAPTTKYQIDMEQSMRYMKGPRGLCLFYKDNGQMLIELNSNFIEN